jgi:hypothetical protein
MENNVLKRKRRWLKVEKGATATATSNGEPTFLARRLYILSFSSFSSFSSFPDFLSALENY